MYSVWSVAMFMFDAIHWDNSFSSFVLYVLKTFFLTGWRQLWYLLAIIYIICLLAAGNKISHRFNDFMYYFSFVFLAYRIAGSKPREVLITKERWQELNMSPTQTVNNDTDDEDLEESDEEE